VYQSIAHNVPNSNFNFFRDVKFRDVKLRDGKRHGMIQKIEDTNMSGELPG
jgi:hypothetical protein